MSGVVHSSSGCLYLREEAPSLSAAVTFSLDGQTHNYFAGGRGRSNYSCKITGPPTSTRSLFLSAVQSVTTGRGLKKRKGHRLVSTIVVQYF